MIHHFDTRWATYEVDDSTRLMTEAEKAERQAPLPRYWVAETAVHEKLQGKWDKLWFLGWRNITNSTNERTVVTTLLPFVGLGHSIPVMLANESLAQVALLQGALSSFAVDFAARQKLGGINLTFFIVEQLPIPAPDAQLDHVDPEWVRTRVDLLNGWISDVDERARVRAEVDAYFFHLYGLSRNEVDHVMETFPITKRHDESDHGTYRTKDLILEAFDALEQEAMPR